MRATVGDSLSSERREMVACRHCGAALTDDAMRAAGFCCAGCAYVFRLVQEHGLASYYHIKDQVTAPADPSVFQKRDFTWLAAAQARAETAATRRPPELTLEVQGISCAGCVWLIERIFSQQPGARDIEANAQTGQMRLRWIPPEFSAGEFARKLQAFGYLVGPGGAAEKEPETRDLVQRIGLCTAFAMNVMLFTLPVYFGMEPSFAYARLFGILSLVGATLSVLVGGSYFFNRAVRALGAGAIHLDLPIAIGIAGAYCGSLFGWFTGREQFIYFDFVAAFIVLMLTGRWAQVAAVARNQRRLLREQPKPPQVRLAGGGSVPPEALTTGMAYYAASGETVPVDSRVGGSDAMFSLASITGEAEPRVFHTGQRVPAGAINAGLMDAPLTALQAWNESLLARLLAPGLEGRVHSALLAKIVRGYLIGILGVALIAGAGWWFARGDALRAGSVVVAVLVVSCPCAIGLAFPLADEMAIVALRKRGVFVRQADLWTRLSAVKQLVFDKTGTLTLETPVLRNRSAFESLSPEAKSALLTLVHDNPHPISQCLLELLLTDSPAPPPMPGQVEETIGQGVALKTSGRSWRLGRPAWASGPAAPLPDEPGTLLTRDGVVMARFQFTDTVRSDAQVEVAKLADLGFPIFVLSGDAPENVSRLAADLGIPAGRALGGLLPAEKAAWLRSHGAEKTMMLGDGANDGLAFDEALCRGTPVIHRGHLAQKADFYYLGRGIAGLRALFLVNGVRRRTQGVILIFSVAYNVLAVGLAVAGRMNPLLAAALMPLNSLATLALVTGGMRRAFDGKRAGLPG